MTIFCPERGLSGTWSSLYTEFEVGAEQNNPTLDHKFHGHSFETGPAPTQGDLLSGRDRHSFGLYPFSDVNCMVFMAKGEAILLPAHSICFSFGIIYEQAGTIGGREYIVSGGWFQEATAYRVGNTG